MADCIRFGYKSKKISSGYYFQGFNKKGFQSEAERNPFNIGLKIDL